MLSSYACLLSGALLVLFIIYDFFYTTISFNGAGPLTKGLSRSLSAVFLYLVHRTSGKKLLKLSGVMHLLLLVSCWIGLLWLGLFLMLASGEGTVIDSQTGTASDLVNKFYFSGYVLSTMGNGDYAPGSERWQVVIALFSFSGFIFITTGISYLVNLTSAVLFKRTLSLNIVNLGETPREIIQHTHSNGSFSSLVKQIPQLRNSVNRHHQNHFAYPAAHDFHSTSPTESVSLNLMRLDVALSYIRYRIKTGPEVEEEIRRLQDAITNFLETLSHRFITPSKFDGDLFQTDHLPESGITLQDEFTEPSGMKQRKALINGYLRSSGWEWEDMFRSRQEGGSA